MRAARDLNHTRALQRENHLLKKVGEIRSRLADDVRLGVVRGFSVGHETYYPEFFFNSMEKDGTDEFLQLNVNKVPVTGRILFFSQSNFTIRKYPLNKFNTK